MDAELASVDRLQEVTERGIWSGFGNLASKEMGLWWSTGRWWKHGLLWLLLMNGLLPLVYFIVKANPDAPIDLLDQLVRAFFQLGGTAATVGLVVAAQDAVIGERQLGTAAWILSKPASRASFVLTKFLAQVFSGVVLMVALQTPIAYAQVGLMTGQWLPPLHWLVGGLVSGALWPIYFLAIALWRFEREEL